MKKTLKEYAEISHTILNNESRYKSNKTIISNLFEQPIEKNNAEIVKNRLTIIDSYYSTQMNKRLYGIEQIAEVIAKYSDAALKTESINFLNNPNQNGVIKTLLTDEYGINKEGKSFGKATSLISKYLYFLNNFQFPIYDRLAFISYKIFKTTIYNSEVEVLTPDNYFECISYLNEITNINNFEKLDNLLWLFGKLTNGSFSILMDIDKYLELIQTNEIQIELEKLENSNEKNKSIGKDEKIREFIKRNYAKSELFTQIQKEFFGFVFSLNHS